MLLGAFYSEEAKTHKSSNLPGLTVPRGGVSVPAQVWLFATLH